MSKQSGLRFSAKLLFQFRVESDEPSIMRTCEERIVVFHAKTARTALAETKRRGKAAQHVYKNDAGAKVHFEFVGVMDLLELGIECGEDEVWYDITTRKLPMERAQEILPSESSLSAMRIERRSSR
jgi:Domain of unknown function (DUF4288)